MRHIKQTIATHVKIFLPILIQSTQLQPVPLYDNIATTTTATTTTTTTTSTTATTTTTTTTTYRMCI